MQQSLKGKIKALSKILRQTLLLAQLYIDMANRESVLESGLSDGSAGALLAHQRSRDQYLQNAKQALSLLDTYSTTEMQAIGDRRLEIKLERFKALSNGNLVINNIIGKILSTHPEYPKADLHNPVEFTHPKILSKSAYADPEIVSEVSHPFTSYEGAVKIELVRYKNRTTGEERTEIRPINPKQNTGYTGRGLLGKWGANFAGDPIITKRDPITREIQVLLIKRKDTGAWALPGGMVDPGEDGLIAAFREAFEEAGVKLAPERITEAKQIYQGYVADPRNTNNAWMETTAFHIHLSDKEALEIKPNADIKETDGFKWAALNEETIKNTYANHGEFLGKVLSNGDFAMQINLDKGGIDLNPANQNLIIQGQGKDFVLPDQFKNMDMAQISGFDPVIVSIVPLRDLYKILGLKGI